MIKSLSVRTMIGTCVRGLIKHLSRLNIEDRIEAINFIKESLHKASPFKDEPVDCVLWIKGERIEANDYNPNAVAPPEMRLLQVSIENDGYTQPIVAFPEDSNLFTVIDGFHRNRVGKECESIKKRTLGYLPISCINPSRSDRRDRIASTIRHNRARGKHRVDAMSDIVVELRRRNWTDEKISRELGMDPDEILRLCQISGLAELFSDREFSSAWDTQDPPPDMEFTLPEPELDE